jgi:3-deoxy-7-phosphoheptulonate synthase
MIIVMAREAAQAQIEAVVERLNAYGFDVHRSEGTGYMVLGAHGVQPDFDVRHIRLLDGVADVFRITSPYKFASRSWRDENTEIRVGDVAIGGDRVVIVAGPCAVESEEQMDAIGAAVAIHGAQMLRGGAFKPRTSPYSFQGLGEEGLRLLRQTGDRYQLKIVTEVMRPSQVGLVSEYADVLQIGARNMQNFDLLREVGRAERPVLLKRGLAATIDDWLMSAEHIIASGNTEVILCERGIRTFETSTRNTLDLSAVPVVQQRSHLPVFVDPSHGVGLRDQVAPMARAAVAAGADGLMIEVHPDPPSALSDGPQSLFIEQFAELMVEVRRVAQAVGREAGAPWEERVPLSQPAPA